MAKEQVNQNNQTNQNNQYPNGKQKLGLSRICRAYQDGSIKDTPVSIRPDLFSLYNTTSSKNVLEFVRYTSSYPTPLYVCPFSVFSVLTNEDLKEIFRYTDKLYISREGCSPQELVFALFKMKAMYEVELECDPQTITHVISYDTNFRANDAHIPSYALTSEGVM